MTAVISLSHFPLLTLAVQNLLGALLDMDTPPYGDAFHLFTSPHLQCRCALGGAAVVMSLSRPAPSHPSFSTRASRHGADVSSRQTAGSRQQDAKSTLKKEASSCDLNWRVCLLDHPSTQGNMRRGAPPMHAHCRDQAIQWNGPSIPSRGLGPRVCLTPCLSPQAPSLHVHMHVRHFGDATTRRGARRWATV